MGKRLKSALRYSNSSCGLPRSSNGVPSRNSKSSERSATATAASCHQRSIGRGAGSRLKRSLPHAMQPRRRAPRERVRRLVAAHRRKTLKEFPVLPLARARGFEGDGGGGQLATCAILRDRRRRARPARCAGGPRAARRSSCGRRGSRRRRRIRPTRRGRAASLRTAPAVSASLRPDRAARWRSIAYDAGSSFTQNVRGASYVLRKTTPGVISSAAASRRSSG